MEDFVMFGCKSDILNPPLLLALCGHTVIWVLIAAISHVIISYDGMMILKVEEKVSLILCLCNVPNSCLLVQCCVFYLIFFSSYL